MSAPDRSCHPIYQFGTAALSHDPAFAFGETDPLPPFSRKFLVPSCSPSASSCGMFKTGLRKRRVSNESPRTAVDDNTCAPILIRAVMKRGVKQRGHDTSYRDGTIPARAGMALRLTSTVPSALGSSADGEMRERDFVDVDALQSCNSSYSVRGLFVAGRTLRSKENSTGE
jgi:hypothetical protein